MKQVEQQLPADSDVPKRKKSVTVMGVGLEVWLFGAGILLAIPLVNMLALPVILAIFAPAILLLFWRMRRSY